VYIDELQWFLWDEFEVWVCDKTISRWMKKNKYRKKKIRYVAAERDQYLRDGWMRRLAKYKHYELCFVDESAANERTKDRKHGWAPIGVRPTVSRPQKRSERWSVLPAYTSSGYIAHRMIQGSFTKQLFLQFLREEVLPRCVPKGVPNLARQPCVVVMDHASIHRGPEIAALFEEFGVGIEYLPPYSPDYNPIEESFAEMKAWMKRNCDLATKFGDDFGRFILLAVEAMADKAGLHFASCCISLED